MKVEVYWNLHKKCWSVRHKGKVVAHVNSIALGDVQWVVRPAGNAKVRREGKKNVHAFARGIVKDSSTYPFPWNVTGPNWQPVTYNPYKHTSFMRYVYGGDRVTTVEVDRTPDGVLTINESGRPQVWARLGDA
jgi:hypothetical protein